MKKYYEGIKDDCFHCFITFTTEYFSRSDFRRLLKHLESYPNHNNWYLGYEGRDVYFRFENKQKAQDFLKEMQEMFSRKGFLTIQTK